MKVKALLPPLTTVVGLFLGISAVFADTSAILLRVEQNNTSDMNPKDRTTKTQKHSLRIYLTNSSPNPADLSAKYTYFGRDMVSHDVVVINSGAQAVSIKPEGEASADIPPATSTYTMEHYQVGARGAKAIKVEASGSRFVGYAVQVYAGSTMVAEAYEPASLKDEVGQAPPASKPGTTPKPAATPAKK